MNIRVTYSNSGGEQWEEMFTQYSSPKAALKAVRKLRKGCKVFWAEPVEGKEHNWELVDKSMRSYRCKDCGLWGVQDGKKVRPVRRVHLGAVLHCEPSRFLANTPESIREAEAVRCSGFREYGKGGLQSRIYDE